MPIGIDKNLLCKIRLFYYSQINASHLLRYLGIRLLKLEFMDIDADRRN